MREKTPRQHAKELQSFFTKVEINGNYLPKDMQKKWGGTFKAEGPTFRERKKDILALMYFFSRANVSLYECLVDAGKQMKARDA
jgi:hypothetical protein